MKLLPFDLKKALEGEKAATGEGDIVEEIVYLKHTKEGSPCVICVIDGAVVCYNAKGESSFPGTRNLNLGMVPKTRKLWIAILKEPIVGNYAFPTTYAYESKNAFDNSIHGIKAKFEVLEIEVNV